LIRTYRSIEATGEESEQIIIMTMMLGLPLKRKLFSPEPTPEPTATLCPDISSSLTVTTNRPHRPNRRNRKRISKPKQKTSSLSSLSAAAAGCHSILASALLDKQHDNMPVKTRRTKRQRNNKNTINHNHNHHEYNDENRKKLYEPSVLMALDTKNNNSTNHNKVQRKQTTKPAQRQQKGNAIQTAATEYIENQGMLPLNSLGGIVSNFASKNRVSSSSTTQNSSKAKNLRRLQSETTKESTRSKATSRRNKLSRKNSRNISEKVCRNGSSIPNGDNLTMCLMERSTTTSNILKPKGVINESVLVGTEFAETKKKSKDSLSRRKKQTKQHQRKPKKKSNINKKSGDQTKRSTVDACKVGGLGAFVGITSKHLITKKFTKERSTRRFVSPLENDLSKTKTPVVPFNEWSITPPITVDTPASDGGPPIRIVTIPQQSEPIPSLASPETIVTTNMKTYNSAYKHDIIGAPSTTLKEVEEQHRHPKFAEGTGKVRYEDGDEEELEEDEVQPVDLAVTELREKQQKRPKSNNQRDSSVDNNRKERVGPTVEPTSQRKLKGDMSLEECVPMRRSRRRSTPPVRLLDSARTIERNESPRDRRVESMHTSPRRSKRRSSQPIRLIDCGNTEEGNGGDCTTSKKKEEGKRKRSVGRREPKSKRASNRKRAKKRKINGHLNDKLKTEEKDIILKNKDNDDQLSVSDQNLTLSPSNPRKQQFDDALRAMMPEECIVEQLAREPDHTEDDIFNATPMRKLFMKNDATVPATPKEEKESEPERRPRRKSIQPDKYDGTYVDTMSTISRKKKKNIKSSMKKKKANNNKDKSKVKRRVRISDEANKECNTDNSVDSNEDGQWASANLKALHTANRSVDPKSFSFWEDVSEIVGTKSATECREKWFSLVNTPVLKRKPKKKDDALSTTLKAPISDTRHNFDDDIFNATPMRGIFDVGENDNSRSTSFDEIGDLSNMVVGSAIKIDKVEHNNASPHGDNKLAAYPQGYKTYIQNMGRNMRQKERKKNCNAGKSSNHPMKIGKNLAERADEGDVEVKCKLSPGGTLQVDTFGDTDTEDYFDYDEE
jgi:hypothetical protein